MKLDASKTIKQLQKELKLSDIRIAKELINFYPMLAFQYHWVDRNLCESIIKEWMPVINLESINRFLDFNLRHDTGFTIRHKYLLDFLYNYEEFRELMTSLYQQYNTHEIAGLLGLSQSTIRHILNDNGLGIANRSMRCSKAHLRIKPYIEQALGRSTITEYYFKKFWIDEFDKVKNIAFEIDGAWCHNKEYDSERDKILLSYGIKTIRIDSLATAEQVEAIVKEFA